MINAVSLTHRKLYRLQAHLDEVGVTVNLLGRQLGSEEEVHALIDQVDVALDGIIADLPAAVDVDGRIAELRAVRGIR